MTGIPELSVTLLSEEKGVHFTTRRLQLAHAAEGVVREVTHFHYDRWRTTACQPARTTSPRCCAPSTPAPGIPDPEPLFRGFRAPFGYRLALKIPANPPLEPDSPGSENETYGRGAQVRLLADCRRDGRQHSRRSLVDRDRLALVDEGDTAIQAALSLLCCYPYM